MVDRDAELKNLTDQFVQAFNDQDIDAVMSFFAEDAVFEDLRGIPHAGLDAIRKAFHGLVTGGAGKIVFDEEDYFAQSGPDKVMTSWTLAMDLGGQRKTMRGLDLLHWRGDKISLKTTYCKADQAKYETVD